MSIHLRAEIRRTNIKAGLKRGFNIVSVGTLTAAALSLGMFVTPAHALTGSLTLNPVADTYVTNNYPDVNFGTASTLISSASAYRTYYMFDTTQLPSSASVNSVSLNLYNVNSHVSGGNVIYPANNASWNENTATWNNQPGYTATALATSATPTSPGTYTNTSLPTTSVYGNGMTNFMVAYSTSGLQHQLSSRESGSNLPQLVINYTTTGSDDTPPTAPSSLASSNLTDNGATLSWSASSDDVAVQWYYVYRDGQLVHVSASYNLSYTDSNGLPATNYTYMVRALDASGNVSSDSNTASIRTTGKPSTIDFSTVSVTSTTATVTGHMNPNGLTTTANFTYGLTTSLGSGTSNQNIGNGTSSVSVNATITGLSPNTTYYFRIQGTNSSGGSYPNPISFTTAP
jgi:hypothetical protein